MGPKKAKELLRAAAARQISIENAENVEFATSEAQLPPPGQGKRTQYIESLTLGRDGFVLTPGFSPDGAASRNENKSAGFIYWLGITRQNLIVSEHAGHCSAPSQSSQ